MRAAADAVAGGKDDSALYGEELRRTVKTFAGSMDESVEASDALDTRPSRPDLGEVTADLSPAPAPAPAPAMVPTKEDETTTQKLQASARPSVSAGVALRPADGVRALVPIAPPSSSPDQRIPPPPLSSSRALAARAIPTPHPSSRDVSRPSFGDMSGAVVAQPPRAPGLASKQKVILAVGVVLTGLVIACAAILGGKSEAKTQPPASVARDAAAAATSALPATTLVAPVVIAPPDPVEEVDAAPPPKPPRSRFPGR